ncbi:ECF RNA polymerase sigma factor SigW [subsurface metagenome]
MDLVEKWQSGDINAFEALFQQYYELVFKTAYFMVGNKQEAEDVLQEVFIAMWKSRCTFDPAKGKLTTWLHRITINKCISGHRKKQAAFFSLEETRDRGFDLLETKSSELPEELLMSKWEYERMMKALGSLEGKHRSTVILRYFNDLSYDEIAQVLGIPLGTVKSRLNQAIRTLRRELEKEKQEYGGAG